MYFRKVSCKLTTGAAIWVLLAGPAIGQDIDSPTATKAVGRPADQVVAAVDSPALKVFLLEVLERNPDLERYRAKAAAAAVRAPQVRALPDPVAMVTAFPLPPETRVGPQRLSVSLSQRLPGFGKLAARERAAVFAAVGAQQNWESQRLTVVTKARELANEWAFSQLRDRIVEEEKHHLVHHEELTRARYSAGLGIQQEVIKIQAAITRAEQRLLEVRIRQTELLADLNALRDRPAITPLGGLELLEPKALALDYEDLVTASLGLPERASAEAEVERRKALVDVAQRDFRPEIRLGFDYTVVERRQDAAGRTVAPQGNGNDILALSAGIELPLHRKRRSAALEQALAEQQAAEAHQRAIEAQIERNLGESRARLPLLFEQWWLFETVLLKQAEESLRSAETAYTTGKLNALELFHSEHVLYEVRLGAARAQADFAIAWARLEGALGSPWKAEEVGNEAG
ncbi:MAG: TolC family protein [Deltaproteobacteria bacterium]|nr:TolC family protein [Deltaproteobacteria bacterium]